MVDQVHDTEPGPLTCPRAARSLLHGPWLQVQAVGGSHLHGAPILKRQKFAPGLPACFWRRTLTSRALDLVQQADDVRIGVEPAHLRASVSQVAHAGNLQRQAAEGEALPAVA